MKKLKIGLGFLVLFTFFFLQTASSITSPAGNFTIMPNAVYFNWSNAELNLTANTDDIILVINNVSTNILPETFLVNQYEATLYSNCLNGTGFILKNETGNYITETKTLNQNESTLFYLFTNLSCPPGKYFGNFSVYDKSNESESVIVNATIIVPISTENVFNESDSSGLYKGFIQKNDNYQSYYFNLSELTENVTGITLTLEDISDDLDLFVFADGNLLGKSINKNSENEEINIDLPISSDMIEIRIYGNVTSTYTGKLYFSNLNFTNTETGEKIEALDFGLLDANETKVLNFNLINEDDNVLNNIVEISELYHIEQWLNQDEAGNFSFLVPKFAKKIKVSAIWTGSDDIDLKLRDNNDNLVGISMNKNLNAVETGAEKEEFIIFDGAFNSSNEGYWHIVVENQTAITSYNLTAYVYLDESLWIDTDFVSGSNLNSSGLENSSQNITIRLSVPERNILNGSYAGILKYGNNAKKKLPFSFSVKVGTLIINNDFGGSTYTLIDNIGFNRTLSANITYSNEGLYPIYYNLTTDYVLRNGANIINFTIDDLPTNPILSGSEGTINFTININTSKTNNVVGIYEGTILFNTTNSTNVSSSSYPYETFILTLRVNLTDQLNVEVIEISPTSIENVSEIMNLTIKTRVKLENESIISKTNVMNLTNFKSVNISERNVSSYIVSLENITNITSTPCDSEYCYFNVSAPKNLAGGLYNLYLYSEYFTGESILKGTSVKGYLYINNTGLYLTKNSLSASSIQENGSITYLNISVKNYGPLTATGSLTLSDCLYTTEEIDTYSSVNCLSDGSSGPRFNINIDGNGSESCWFRWKITSGFVSSDQTCSFNILTTDKKFADLSGIDVTITNYVAPQQNNNNNKKTEIECYSDLNCAWNYKCSNSKCVKIRCSANEDIENHKCVPKYSLEILKYEKTINVLIGSSNTTEIKVKNLKNTIEIKLIIIVNDKVNVSITPESYKMSANDEKTFTVKFTVPENISIGNYPITFKVQKADDSSVSILKTANLAVLPGEKEKKEILQKYNKYSVELNRLLQNYAWLKSVLGKENLSNNLTNAESLLNESLRILNKLENAINTSDFITANTLLGALDEKINATDFRLRILEGIANPGLGTWSIALMAIVIIAIVVGFVYGLPKVRKTGYHGKKKYIPKGQSYLSRVHKHLKKYKNKITKKIGEKIKRKAGSKRSYKYKYKR